MLAYFRDKLRFELVGAVQPAPFKRGSAIALKFCLLSIVVGISSRLPAGEMTSDVKVTSPPSSHDDATGASDETRLLIEQLNKLEIWSAIEPPAGEGADIPSRKTASRGGEKQTVEPPPPLIIPGLIDRPDEIDDQNVGPIPTGPTDTVEGPASKAVTATIPVIPEAIDAPPKRVVSNASSDQKPDPAKQTANALVNIYETTPRLLTQSADTTTAATTEPSNNSAGIWQLAAAQLVATFLGVVLAAGLFLLIRVTTVKLFGVHLGVTFQFGSTSDSSAQTSPIDESADVDSFDTQTSQTRVTTSTVQPDEPKQAGRIAEPAEFPFRVVGTSNGEGDSAAEGSVTHQSEAAILKSVFDNNLNLTSELDKHNGSAA
ncbi:MAG: hypothetical protein ACKVHE_19815 [Planctomycetales bacterium]|jgi:hypothetical protein